MGQVCSYVFLRLIPKNVVTRILTSVVLEGADLTNNHTDYCPNHCQHGEADLKKRKESKYKRKMMVWLLYAHTLNLDT